MHFDHYSYWAIVGGTFAIANDWGQSVMTVLGLIVGLGGLLCAASREIREWFQKGK